MCGDTEGQFTAGVLEGLVLGSVETRGRGGNISEGKGLAEQGWNYGTSRRREKRVCWKSTRQLPIWCTSTIPAQPGGPKSCQRSRQYQEVDAEVSTLQLHVK